MAKLAALAEMALGHPLDQRTLESLLAIQETLRIAQSKLVQLFDAGELTADEYLIRLNAILEKAMQDNRTLLGDERFQAIFGDAGRYLEGLVDQKIFQAHAARKAG